MKRISKDAESEVSGTFVVGNKYLYRGEECKEYKSGKEYEFMCMIKCACGCEGYKLLFRGEKGSVPFVNDDVAMTDLNGRKVLAATALCNGSSQYDWYSEEEMAVIKESPSAEPPNPFPEV